jgi:hypothetical protein
MEEPVLLGVAVEVGSFFDDFEVVAFVAHLVEFAAGSAEGAVEDHHELAVEGAEEHAVSAVLMNERGELEPGAFEVVGLGTGDGLDVVAAGCQTEPQ